MTTTTDLETHLLLFKLSRDVEVFGLDFLESFGKKLTILEDIFQNLVFMLYLAFEAKLKH